MDGRTSILDGIVGALATLTIISFKPEWNTSNDEKFDILGSILLGLSIMLIICGFSNMGWTYKLILLVLGFIGLFVFYFVERRSDYPLINLDLFKSKSYIFGSVTGMINYSSFIAVNFVLSQYL